VINDDTEFNDNANVAGQEEEKKGGEVNVN